MRTRRLGAAALAVTAAALTTLGSGVASAQTAREHPPITDPAGDTRGGLLGQNVAAADLLSADITLDGDTVTFVVETAAINRLPGGSYRMVGTFPAANGERGAPFRLVVPGGASTGTLYVIGDGQFGGGGPNLEGPVTYDNDAGTTSVTFPLSELNDAYGDILSADSTIFGVAAFTTINRVVFQATDRTDNVTFTLGG